MSMTTIVFIAILVFFVWRGYQKGFVGAISRVLSFLIAYPAAIFLTKPFAKLLHSYIGLDGLILFLIAGCTIFAVVSLIVTLILNGIARLIPHNQYTETSSKIGGAAFGILIGGLFGLIAVYVIDIFAKPTHTNAELASTQDSAATKKDARAIAETGAEAETIKKYVMAEGAPVKDSFLESTAKKFVSTAASTAVGIVTSDKNTADITRVMTQDPQATLNHVQNMTNNGELKQLLNNPDFQQELNHGNTASLMQNKDFKQLMQNPDMQAIIASGSGDDISGESNQQAAAEKMLQAWQKVATLKTDPRVLAIVSDPAFQAQLNSANKLPLLMNPKMRELSEIIFSSDGAGASDTTLAPQQSSQPTKVHYTVEDITEDNRQQARATEEAAKAETGSPNSKKEEQTETKLYRWTDENGKVHFSDKPIKNTP
jgi:uncharacterized membrane protein required for colicin V production